MNAALLRLPGRLLPLLLALCTVACADDDDRKRDKRAAHVVLVGDSTVAEDSGWGKVFAKALARDVKYTNTAHGGASSKSCLESGAWTRALELKPTWMLIQFGHNDLTGKDLDRATDPDTTFRANLIRFVDEARAAGAKPILITPIPRRLFRDGKIIGDLAPYAAAARKVAAEKQVPLADLFARSIPELEKLGPAQASLLGPWSPFGKPDPTHLNKQGARFTVKLLADELRRVAPDLAHFLRAD